MLESMLLFLNLGGGEIMLIVLAALLMFGGKKLPELARGLGRGIREFKDASESIKQDINDQINNFGKDLDVSEPVNSKPTNISKTEQPKEDYNDGGQKQPDYKSDVDLDAQNADEVKQTSPEEDHPNEVPKDTVQKP